jgi:hypothetical protein
LDTPKGYNRRKFKGNHQLEHRIKSILIDLQRNDSFLLKEKKKVVPLQRVIAREDPAILS